MAMCPSTCLRQPVSVNLCPLTPVFVNPARGCSLQPSGCRTRLPWEYSAFCLQPQRGCGSHCVSN